MRRYACSMPFTLLLLAAAGLGCEDPPKAESAPAAAASSAGSPSSGSAAAAPAPGPAAEGKPAEPEKPVVKKPGVCATGSKPSFVDPSLEKEVRRKAGKAEGEELSLADVRKIRSVDLTRSGAEI